MLPLLLCFLKYYSHTVTVCQVLFGPFPNVLRAKDALVSLLGSFVTVFQLIN